MEPGGPMSQSTVTSVLGEDGAVVVDGPPRTPSAPPVVDTVTTTLSNGLTCDIPASSPLAKLMKSQRTWFGPDAKQRLKILRAAKSVAIVGASPNPARSSYFVGTYLLSSSDYRVYFVHPNADEILGQPVYKSPAELPEVPDIVDAFRKSRDMPSVIDDVLAVG